MIEELTAAQIAARIGVSERTIQRNIASGKLKARPLRNHKYVVDSDDVDALVLPDHHNDLSRIEALEQEVRRLALVVDALSRGRTETAAPRPRILQPTLPEYTTSSQKQDAITARNFAETHKISRERMEKWIKQDAFETTPEPYRDSVKHMLTPDQQHAVIAYWNANNIIYTACPQCPH